MSALVRQKTKATLADYAKNTKRERKALAATRNALSFRYTTFYTKKY